MVRPKHETQMVFEPLPLPEGREDMINTPSEMKLPSKANKNIHLECITNPVLRGPRKMAEEKNKTVSETLHTQAKNLNSEDQQRIHKEEKLQVDDISENIRPRIFSPRAKNSPIQICLYSILEVHSPTPG